MAFLDLPPYSLEMVQETWTGNVGRTQEFSLIHSGSSPSFRGAGDDTWLCSGICAELPMQASVQTLSVCRKHTQPFSCESQKNLHAQYLSPHSLRPVLFSPPPTHFPYSPTTFLWSPFPLPGQLLSLSSALGKEVDGGELQGRSTEKRNLSISVAGGREELPFYSFPTNKN